MDNLFDLFGAVMLFKSLLIATIASTHAFVPPTAGARSVAHSRAAAVVVSGASVVEAPVVATAERKPCFSGDAYGRAAWAAPTVPKKAAAEKKAAPAPAPTPVLSKEDEAAKARWRQPKQPLRPPSPALAIDSMGVEGDGEGGDESSMQPGWRSIDTLAAEGSFSEA